MGRRGHKAMSISMRSPADSDRRGAAHRPGITRPPRSPPRGGEGMEGYSGIRPRRLARRAEPLRGGMAGEGAIPLHLGGLIASTPKPFDEILHRWHLCGRSEPVPQQFEIALLIHEFANLLGDGAGESQSQQFADRTPSFLQL